MHTLDITHPYEFYSRPTTEVAKDLLGAILCRRLPDGEVRYGRIVETEAYRDNEPACHAFRGPTPRCGVMFGPPGISYVYFIYGTNHCLNVVTEQEGRGCAVLIRAVEGESMNGPGRICRQLSITREHNGVDLTSSQSALWIAIGEPLTRAEISASPRIGVTAAEDLPWRFFVRNHKDLSGPKALNRGSYEISASTARRARLLEKA